MNGAGKIKVRKSLHQERVAARRAEGLAQAEALGYRHGFAGKGWDDSDWYKDGGALEAAYDKGFACGEDSYAGGCE